MSIIEISEQAASDMFALSCRDSLDVTTIMKDQLISRGRKFSYTDILNITDNFKTVIGEGGFGKVYVGNLHDGTQVAVKLLSPLSNQGDSEFQAEVCVYIYFIYRMNIYLTRSYCSSQLYIAENDPQAN